MCIYIYILCVTEKKKQSKKNGTTPAQPCTTYVSHFVGSAQGCTRHFLEESPCAVPCAHKVCVCPQTERLHKGPHKVNTLGACKGFSRVFWPCTRSRTSFLHKVAAQGSTQGIAQGCGNPSTHKATLFAQRFFFSNTQYIHIDR